MINALLPFEKNKAINPTVCLVGWNLYGNRKGYKPFLKLFPQGMSQETYGIVYGGGYKSLESRLLSDLVQAYFRIFMSNKENRL